MDGDIDVFLGIAGDDSDLCVSHQYSHRKN